MNRDQVGLINISDIGFEDSGKLLEMLNIRVIIYLYCVVSLISVQMRMGQLGSFGFGFLRVSGRLD